MKLVEFKTKYGDDVTINLETISGFQDQKLDYESHVMVFTSTNHVFLLEMSYDEFKEVMKDFYIQQILRD